MQIWNSSNIHELKQQMIRERVSKCEIPLKVRQNFRGSYHDWHTLFCFTIILFVYGCNTQQEIKCGTLAHPFNTKSCYASTILVNRNPYNKASPYRRFVKRSWSTIEKNEFGVWHAIKRIMLSRRHFIKPCKNIL